MIADFLPEYYEAFGRNPTYTVLRSIVVDGHEVAWMRFCGTVGTEENKATYEGNTLYCECDFKQGVGWKMFEGKPCGICSRNECLPRQAAIYLRQLELRREYLHRFRKTTYGEVPFLSRHTHLIVKDLIKRVRAEEFIGEDGDGAEFWGGYFYLQTLAKILDLSLSDVWQEAEKLVAQKKISLEGAVVRRYHKPPPPKWEEYTRVEEDGLFGVASLPAHSKMPQEWKLEIYDSKGMCRKEGTLPLMYEPDFGPDVSDIETMMEKLKTLMDIVRQEESTHN